MPHDADVNMRDVDDAVDSGDDHSNATVEGGVVSSRGQFGSSDESIHLAARISRLLYPTRRANERPPPIATFRQLVRFKSHAIADQLFQFYWPAAAARQPEAAAAAAEAPAHEEATADQEKDDSFDPFAPEEDDDPSATPPPGQSSRTPSKSRGVVELLDLPDFDEAGLPSLANPASSVKPSSRKSLGGLRRPVRGWTELEESQLRYFRAPGREWTFSRIADTFGRTTKSVERKWYTMVASGTSTNTATTTPKSVKKRRSSGGLDNEPTEDTDFSLKMELDEAAATATAAAGAAAPSVVGRSTLGELRTPSGSPATTQPWKSSEDTAMRAYVRKSLRTSGVKASEIEATLYTSRAELEVDWEPLAEQLDRDVRSVSKHWQRLRIRAQEDAALQRSAAAATPVRTPKKRTSLKREPARVTDSEDEEESTADSPSPRPSARKKRATASATKQRKTTPKRTSQPLTQAPSDDEGAEEKEAEHDKDDDQQAAAPVADAAAEVEEESNHGDDDQEDEDYVAPQASSSSDEEEEDEEEETSEQEADDAPQSEDVVMADDSNTKDNTPAAVESDSDDDAVVVSPPQPTSNATAKTPKAATSSPSTAPRAAASAPTSTSLAAAPAVSAAPSSVAASDSVPSGEDHQNDDYCHLCGKTGELLVCERCPRSYHELCLIVHHASNKTMLAELGEEEDFVCRLAKLRCTARKEATLLPDQPEQSQETEETKEKEQHETQGTTPVAPVDSAASPTEATAKAVETVEPQEEEKEKEDDEEAASSSSSDSDSSAPAVTAAPVKPSTEQFDPNADNSSDEEDDDDEEEVRAKPIVAKRPPPDNEEDGEDDDDEEEEEKKSDEDEADDDEEDETATEKAAKQSVPKSSDDSSEEDDESAPAAAAADISSTVAPIAPSSPDATPSQPAPISSLSPAADSDVEIEPAPAAEAVQDEHASSQMDDNASQASSSSIIHSSPLLRSSLSPLDLDRVLRSLVNDGWPLASLRLLRAALYRGASDAAAATELDKTKSAIKTMKKRLVAAVAQAENKTHAVKRPAPAAPTAPAHTASPQKHAAQPNKKRRVD